MAPCRSPMNRWPSEVPIPVTQRPAEAGMPDGQSSPAPSRQVIVDAHLHVWDPGRLDYPWLGDVPALNRRFGPADLDLAGLGPEVRFAGAVFVEAGRRDELALAEVEWVEELAERW